MVVTLLLAWPALAVLAALFMYCCSSVSHESGHELAGNEPPPDHRPMTSPPPARTA